MELGMPGGKFNRNGLAIQQVVSEAVSKVVGHAVQIQGSGRTDAGSTCGWPSCVLLTESWTLDADRLVQAINCHLPRDIVVLEVAASCRLSHPDSKRDRQTLSLLHTNVPCAGSFAVYASMVDSSIIGYSGDAVCGISYWGTHNFIAFQTLGSVRKTTTRTIRCIDLQFQEAIAGIEWIVEIEADGFLYNMARKHCRRCNGRGRQGVSPRLGSATYWILASATPLAKPPRSRIMFVAG
jgi:tRNA pseudouridine38-40 synthase